MSVRKSGIEKKKRAKAGRSSVNAIASIRFRYGGFGRKLWG